MNGAPTRPAAALTARRAAPDEFDTVMCLLADSIAWLRGRGLDQWSGWQAWHTKMAPSLRRGDVWLLCDGGDLVGTVTVEMSGDPDFWTPAELAEPAAYVSKLAVRRDRAGAGLGSVLLGWASDHAYRHGCRWVRLDAWKTNTGLHGYYRDLGWTYVRTSANPRRRSGALFQVPAAPLGAAGAARIGEVPPLPVVPGTVRLLTEYGDPAGEVHADHVHVASRLIVRYEHIGDQPALLLPTYRYRVGERDGGWVLEASPDGAAWWERHGPALSAGWPLTPGATYVLSHQSGGTWPCGVSKVDVVGGVVQRQAA